VTVYDSHFNFVNPYYFIPDPTDFLSKLKVSGYKKAWFLGTFSSKIHSQILELHSGIKFTPVSVW
jgi:hypothetical protein